MLSFTQDGFGKSLTLVRETGNCFHSCLSPKTANPGFGCYAPCWLALSWQSKAGDIELVSTDVHRAVSQMHDVLLSIYIFRNQFNGSHPSRLRDDQKGRQEESKLGEGKKRHVFLQRLSCCLLDKVGSIKTVHSLHSKWFLGFRTVAFLPVLFQRKAASWLATGTLSAALPRELPSRGRVLANNSVFTSKMCSLTL